VIPGLCISTSKYEMPLCLGADGSVRTSSTCQSARCAKLVHTFWPLITKGRRRAPRASAGPRGRSRRRVRNTLAPDFLAGQHLEQVALFLLLSAEVHDSRTDSIDRELVGAVERQSEAQHFVLVDSLTIMLAPPPPHSLGQCRAT